MFSTSPSDNTIRLGLEGEAPYAGDSLGTFYGFTLDGLDPYVAKFPQAKLTSRPDSGNQNDKSGRRSAMFAYLTRKAIRWREATFRGSGGVRASFHGFRQLGVWSRSELVRIDLEG